MSRLRTNPAVRRFALILALDAGIVAGLYALEPTLVTDTIRSPRALALVAVTVVATMLLGRVGRRFGGAWGGAAGAAIPLVLVGVLVVAPAVRDVRLDEPLPDGLVALPAAAGSATPTATTSRSSEPSSEPAPPAPTSAASAAAPAQPGPALVSRGRVEGIGHTASGTVAIFRLADGSHIVRFEEVALEGAPDPVLWLVPGRDQRSRTGGTEVGPLKATHGSFHHAVPAGFDVTQDLTVFVWCQRFATPIANSTQDRA